MGIFIPSCLSLSPFLFHSLKASILSSSFHHQLHTIAPALAFEVRPLFSVWLLKGTKKREDEISITYYSNAHRERVDCTFCAPHFFHTKFLNIFLFGNPEPNLYKSLFRSGRMCHSSAYPIREFHLKEWGKCLTWFVSKNLVSLNKSKKRSERLWSNCCIADFGYL